MPGPPCKRAIVDIRGGIFALLTLPALLAAGAAQGQARGDSIAGIQERAKERALLERTPEVRAQRVAEMDAWLRRLRGRFQVTGTGGERLEDCIGIGNGPGVQCVRGPPPYVDGVSGPSMIMYGMDPGEPGVRYLLVNERSIAESDLGKLSGNTVTFRTVSCPKSLDQQPRVMVMTCERRLRIYAAPGSRHVLMEYITERLVILPTPAGGRARGAQLVTTREQIHLHRLRTE